MISQVWASGLCVGEWGPPRCDCTAARWIWACVSACLLKSMHDTLVLQVTYQCNAAATMQQQPRGGTSAPTPARLASAQQAQGGYGHRSHLPQVTAVLTAAVVVSSCSASTSAERASKPPSCVGLQHAAGHAPAQPLAVTAVCHRCTLVAVISPQKTQQQQLLTWFCSCSKGP